MRKRVFVINWHSIIDENDNATKDFFPLSFRGPDSVIFSKQLQTLKENFSVCSWPDFFAFLKGEKDIDDNSFLITFDDGLRSCYTRASSVLREHQLHAVFFLSPFVFAEKKPLSVHLVNILIQKLGEGAFVEQFYALLNNGRFVTRIDPAQHGVDDAYIFENTRRKQLKFDLNYALNPDDRDPILFALFEKHVGSLSEWSKKLYMTKTMVAELVAEGHIIGSHSYSHRLMSLMDKEKQYFEIQQSKQLIENITHQDCHVFSYPQGVPGCYNDDTVQILQQNNFSCAFSVENKWNTFKNMSPFALYRFDYIKIFQVDGTLHPNFSL